MRLRHNHYIVSHRHGRCFLFSHPVVHRYVLRIDPQFEVDGGLLILGYALLYLPFYLFVGTLAGSLD